MPQQCVCRDIEHLGSLESTQKARVAKLLRLFRAVQTSRVLNISGEGKRRNEFAEWHVAWLAE